MKRIFSLLTALVLTVSLVACGGPTWQEQYDLGIRYLTEGNYEEAILAFTAAIEIDDKQPLAYIGRGDAYAGSAGIPEDTPTDQQKTLLEQAVADYLLAIDLDETQLPAYLSAADLYVLLGDTDAARELLLQGYEATGDQSLLDKAREWGPLDDDEVEWTDPVLEQMVRGAIGIPDGPVYSRDLDEIYSLSIYGNTHIFLNGAGDSLGIGYRYIEAGELVAFYEVNGRKYTTRGEIRDIRALRYFRNLHSVSVMANHVQDISVLDQLSQLTYACFFANDITDLSPLDRFSPETIGHQEQFVEIGDLLEQP